MCEVNINSYIHKGWRSTVEAVEVLPTCLKGEKNRIFRVTRQRTLSVPSGSIGVPDSLSGPKIRVMLVVPLLNSSISILVLRCLNLVLRCLEQKRKWIHLLYFVTSFSRLFWYCLVCKKR
jgi:hypothetical protein